MQRRHILIPGFLLAAGLYLTSCLWWGIWTKWDSRYSLNSLTGLSPAQVVQRLGTPYLDPRQPPMNWKNEQEDGPLALAYRSGVYYVTIRFSDGKVVRVDHYAK